MNFRMDEAVEVLERTPQTLEVFLSGLSEGWLRCNEGEGTWNASEVIDHLIEAEKTNWIPRLEAIMQQSESRVFPPFDRYAHFKERTEGPIGQRLQQFKTLRLQNTAKLKGSIDLDEHLERTGMHPTFGEVRLSELLAAWVVHDFTHMAQIVRVMAERYREDVGPYQAFLSILKK
jgi:uncharacterized damage-inducible protein DinB